MGRGGWKDKKELDRMTHFWFEVSARLRRLYAKG